MNAATRSTTTEAGKRRRIVRSYVRREGRITHAQRRALQELWPRYGIDNQPGALDFSAVFGRTAPVVLEIGFGNGDALCAMAAAHPENDYLGIEVHRPGIGRTLHRLAAEDVDNVRVIVGDAKEVLGACVPDDSLAAVHLFFPDPWPKKRHHKRRLMQQDFAALLLCKLRPLGYVHMATDWEDYARHMLGVMSAIPAFENAAGTGNFAPWPGERPLTKFERRGQRLGHRVRDLVFRRVP